MTVRAEDVPPVIVRDSSPGAIATTIVPGELSLTMTISRLSLVLGWSMTHQTASTFHKEIMVNLLLHVICTGRIVFPTWRVNRLPREWANHRLDYNRSYLERLLVQDMDILTGDFTHYFTDNIFRIAQLHRSRLVGPIYKRICAKQCLYYEKIITFHTGMLLRWHVFCKFSCQKKMSLFKIVFLNKSVVDFHRTAQLRGGRIVGLIYHKICVK